MTGPDPAGRPPWAQLRPPPAPTGVSHVPPRDFPRRARSRNERPSAAAGSSSNAPPAKGRVTFAGVRIAAAVLDRSGESGLAQERYKGTVSRDGGALPRGAECAGAAGLAGQLKRG